MFKFLTRVRKRPKADEEDSYSYVNLSTGKFSGKSKDEIKKILKMLKETKGKYAAGRFTNIPKETSKSVIKTIEAEIQEAERELVKLEKDN